MNHKIFISSLIFLFINCNSFNKKIYVEDIDGNIYPYTKIGTIYWLQENLKTEHYQNGDKIIYIKNDSQWINSKFGALCYYNNNINNKHVYGVLYNWYVASDNRNVCPIGWEVASRKDFFELSNFYGGNKISGQYLKDNNDNLWIKPNSPIVKESKFKSIPSGHRGNIMNVLKTFDRLGFYAFYWTKDDELTNNCIPDTLGCAYECSLYGFKLRS